MTEFRLKPQLAVEDQDDTPQPIGHVDVSHVVGGDACGDAELAPSTAGPAERCHLAVDGQPVSGKQDGNGKEQVPLVVDGEAFEVDVFELLLLPVEVRELPLAIVIAGQERLQDGVQVVPSLEEAVFIHHDHRQGI